MISEAVTAGANRGDDAQDFRPVGADQTDIDAAGDQRLERRIVRRPAEAVEAPVLQARNARCELEAKEGAEREHMVGISAAVGMVATDRDLALMVEQRIEHMQRLARRCRDELGEERPIAVGEMGVDLEPRLLAVVSVEAAGGTAKPAGLEELP